MVNRKKKRKKIKIIIILIIIIKMKVMLIDILFTGVAMKEHLVTQA